ncbi:MAG: MFS transporter [Ancrocorticia sp.]|uniref:MFS transporter n=1 Tax=Ancrocorticia sp. TaxID=2593684 RepID=UPI003F91787B
MSALAQYKVLPQISSGSAMALAVAARAPYAMIPLGTMTAVTASTGSVATGGLATAFTSIALAVASPLIGRWADHAGQRFVLSLLTPINALSLLLLVYTSATGTEGTLLWLACLLAGGTSLPIGSFTRARWVAMVGNNRQLSAALSYESTVDELVFVLGPALVGVAASAAIPVAPLIVAAALVIVAGIPFALTAPTRLDPMEAHTTRPSIVSILAAVAPAIGIMMCIGAFFGSVQTATTERALELGSPSVAGLVYAVMGIGSAVMALMAVAIPESVRTSTRVLVGGLGMMVFIVTTTAASGSLILTAAGLLITGLFVGPTMVTAFSVTEKLAPSGGTGVAMTSMQSAITIGVSVGSSVGGGLAATGAGHSYLFAGGAGLIIIAIGVALRVAGNVRRERTSSSSKFL